MAKSQAADSGGALLDRIARQQRAGRLTAIKQKVQLGQPLTVREEAELRKLEAEQVERYGRQYIAAMPKADYCDFVGRQSKQLIEAAQRYGFPYPLGRKEPVDVGRVLRWFHTFLAANAGLLSGSDEHDEILQLASGKLKDEYVREKIRGAQLDNERKTIENAVRVDECLPIEPTRALLNYVADRARKVREKLQQKLTGEPLEIADRLYEDMIDDVARFVEDHFNAKDFENSETGGNANGESTPDALAAGAAS